MRVLLYLCIGTILWWCGCGTGARIKGIVELAPPFCFGGREWAKSVHWLQAVLCAGVWQMPWFAPYLCAHCSAAPDHEAQ